MSKPPKSRPRDRSPLYRLIAAGQMVHRALLAPALARGLEPGDDAVLYLLAAGPLPETELAIETGLDARHLGHHLGRLIDHEYVRRRAIGPDMRPHLTLTAQGESLAARLSQYWDELEHALLGELKPRQRRVFGKRLARLVTLLNS